jgi:hypothetical protein
VLIVGVLSALEAKEKAIHSWLALPESRGSLTGMTIKA